MTHQLRPGVSRDFPRLSEIRSAVRENRLSDPAKVTQRDYDRFVGNGAVWVAESDGVPAGFSAADVKDGSIWALFVDPACEGRGIGADLLARACTHLERLGFAEAVLTTDPGTRAEAFYRRRGWQEIGRTDEGEVRLRRRLGGDAAVADDARTSAEGSVE